MNKKIVLGPVDPLIKETEIKTFIKEFESKRGDRDILGLHQSTQNANATIQNAKNSILQSSFHLDNINKSLAELNNKINAQIDNEAVHQEQRDVEVKNKVCVLDSEKKQYEDSLLERKKLIDDDFAEKANQLRDKYQIVL
eukprot:gene3598-4480_t